MVNEKWTADELLLANEQVLAATETKLAKLKRRHTDAAYEATEDVAVELACQRNRALAALKVIVAHEDAVTREFAENKWPDVELTWMEQARAAITACEGKL